MPFDAGTKIGRYEIQSLLGAGGMGEVYLALDEKLGRKVALKILSRKPSNSPQTIRRFTQEARAASSLNHSNIAHIYEIDELEDLNLIAMEYVDGMTLRQRVASASLTLREALNISIQVAGALAAAHAAGIIHRDIKAENVMVTADGHIKVLDFGLAKHIDIKSELTDPGASTVSKVSTAPGIVMGTINYMSPEQARGQTVDSRTDIWSLGVLMYEMICARTPFDAPTSSDVIAAILHNEPSPLARFARNVPETLEWIVMKALTKNPDGRYQTAKELIADLEKLKSLMEFEAALELSVSNDGFSIPERISERISNSLRASASHTASITPALPTSSAEYIVNRIKRHKVWAAIITGVALCAVVGAVAALWFFKREPDNASPQRSFSPRRLMRLPYDSDIQSGHATLQSTPSWSPDGKFIAYSSNRLNEEDFNIWVQQVDGGNPVQVTRSPYHDLQPDWSPNGSSIVFRSERGEQGGLFIIPVLGGIERKVSSFGYRPRWSPDGSKILFLDTGDRLFDYPRLFVKALDDSQPVEISTDVGDHSGIKQGAVAWHPDSKQISFISPDGVFWTVSTTGGPPVKSEIASSVREQMKESAVDLGNFCWDASGKYLYFEGRSRGVTDIWRFTVDSQLRWINGPDKLTTSTGRIGDIALSSDGKRLAFITTDQKTRIWLLPFDARTGQAKAKQADGARAVTSDGIDPLFSDISRDGKKLVFGARRPGSEKQELWVKALDGSHEQMLQADDLVRFFPRWSPDSKTLAYSRFRVENNNQRSGAMFLLDAGGGEERLVTSNGAALDYAYDWSSDGQWLLAATNRRDSQRWEIGLFPLRAAPRAEAEMRIMASDTEYNLWAPRFSPDGQWISYVAQKGKGARASVIYVIPAQGGTPVRITDETAWCDWPRWAPDGKTIYFVSNFNSSFLSVWGIKFDPVQQQVVGKPFQVTSFGSPIHMIPPRLSHMEMALDQTQLIIPITEITGNIWIMDNPGN